MKNKTYLLLLFYTSTIMGSAIDERSNIETVIVINNLTQNFICSIQTKSSSCTGDSTDEDYGTRKKLRLGSTVQSLLIAPQGALNLPVDMAKQIEEYCRRNSYNIEHGVINRTMTISSNNG